MQGWQGNILHINLTTRTTRIEQPVPAIYNKWIGGKGLAGYYLRPYVTHNWDDEHMPLIFMTGPLVGTPSPTSGRMCIMSRSPLTGAIADCSVGGKLASEIKKCGYDGLVISGKSSGLTGIKIEGSTVSFQDAASLKGYETGRLFKHINPKGALACTGPAAEHGVLYANIMVDGKFSAGRGGLGLVMAQKGLKYLSVAGGKIKTSIAYPESLKSAREEIFRLTAASPVLMGEHGIANYGTGALYDLMDSRHMMPTANFRRTKFDKAAGMNAVAYKNKFSPKRTGCRGCHILCKKSNREGVHIPEFETMSHFSALLENCDLEAVVEANSICNEMGMDTISAAVTLACYSEINSLKLSADSIKSLLTDTALSQNQGKELGQGSYRYALSKGKSSLSFSVKKMELPAYDPRGAYGMALAYATSTRGGCHLRAYPISHEILRKPVATDRFTFEGKARIIKIAEDANAVVDSLTACKFVFFASSLEEYAKALSAVTGQAFNAQDLLNTGERIYYHEQIMNNLNSFTSLDDDLPPRFFEEEGTSGHGIEVPALSRADFLKARKGYYAIRGLSEEGAPTLEKAQALDLSLAGPDDNI